MVTSYSPASNKRCGHDGEAEGTAASLVRHHVWRNTDLCIKPTLDHVPAKHVRRASRASKVYVIGSYVVHSNDLTGGPSYR